MAANKEFNETLDNKEVSTTSNTVSTSIDYYQVVGTPTIKPSSITYSTTLPEGTVISYDFGDFKQEEIKPLIVEKDQKRKIIFNANELLKALGLPEGEDKEIELDVVIKGRECDQYGHPIE